MQIRNLRATIVVVKHKTSPGINSGIRIIVIFCRFISVLSETKKKSITLNNLLEAEFVSWRKHET